MKVRAYFFIRENGDSPVEHYLGSLSEPREVAAIQALVERLMMMNGRMPRPHAAHVEDKIWELRTRMGNRIFYFIHDGPAIILLTGYTKKRDRIEPRVMKQVQKLFKEYMLTNKRKPF